MNRYRTLMLLVLAVSLTACRNTDITNLQDTDLGDGDGVSDVYQTVSIRIVPDGATGIVGDTLRARVQCLNRFGGQVTPCDVVWSSDSGAITVSGGLITFVVVGMGEVCATLEVNGISIKGCGYFTTKAVIPPPDTTAVVTAVTASPSQVTLWNGSCGIQFQQLTAVVSGSANVPQGVRWTSLNPAVATVDSLGYVLARGVGITTVWAVSVVDNTKVGTVSVTVSACQPTSDVYTIELLPKGATGAVGTTLQTTAVCRKNGVVTNECDPRWYTSDGMRITVGETTGIISYLFKGQAVICVQWSSTMVNPHQCWTFYAN